MTLHKGRLPAMIVEKIVDEKQQLTISELAKDIGTTKESVAVALSNLRKKGISIHPIGGVQNPKEGIFEEGKLVDVTSDKEYFIEVNERYKNQLNPRLATQILNIENAWQQYPELRENIERNLEELQIKLLEEKQELRQLTQSNGN